MRARNRNEPLGAANARAPRESSPTVSVPLFRSMLEALPEDRRIVILDLGAARPETIALLAPRRCRLYITDLTGTVTPLLDSSDPDQLAALAERDLPALTAEPADLVLCWDFLNYLERPGLRALMACIAARCRAGALAHALICYSDGLMQQTPGRFVPVDAGRFQDLSTDPPSRVAPRYSPEDIRLCMPEFRIERARLLRNGMQEYLLRVQA